MRAVAVRPRPEAGQPGEQGDGGDDRGEAIGRVEPRFPRELVLQARQRKLERIEPLQADRGRRGDQAGGEQPAASQADRSRRRAESAIHARKKAAADPEEQPAIDDELRYPQRSANDRIAGGGGRRHRALGAPIENTSAPPTG